ncbi:MAG TPA: ATP-binding cassette domain-containing protein [Dehalococcoidia bacterium]|nr:ATP-binding cassette domain-containing protein [Dehalococcoidia bacterium]
MPAIAAEGLVKHFSAEIRAVDGIDLEIPEGMIFGFLGANGSGKTTTVRMLTTLLRPTAGRARVAGFDVTASPGEVRESIGVALQEAGLDDLQTGRELLRLQARLYRVPPREVEARVAHLLRVVDLEDAADRRVKTYSGGMQRRLDLAAALVHRPSVVFLDEPTTGLDPISREAIWRYVVELNRSEGVTFFLTTQYLEEADRLAVDVAIMDRGRIVAQGSPAALKSSISTDVVTLQIAGGADELARAEQAVRRLEGAEDVRVVDDAVIVYTREGSAAIMRLVLLLNDVGVRAHAVTLAQPTLDDVFLRKTGHHIEPAEAAGAAAGGRD